MECLECANEKPVRRVRYDWLARRGYDLGRWTKRRLSVFAAGVLKDGWHTGQAIDARIHQQADFVDQTCFEKRAVDPAAALEEEDF
jgi:hypothetical protein